MENVRIDFDAAGNQSLAYVDDRLAGECQFEVKGGLWTIIHTGVRPEFGGRGIARLLVERIMLEARAKGVKINPVCSYAKKMMAENKAYDDVLAKV